MTFEYDVQAEKVVSCYRVIKAFVKFVVNVISSVKPLEVPFINFYTFIVSK